MTEVIIVLTAIYFIFGLILIIIAFSLKKRVTSFANSARNASAVRASFKQMWVTYTILGCIGIIFGIITLCGLTLSKWVALIYVIAVLILSMIFGLRLVRQL